MSVKGEEGFEEIYMRLFGFTHVILQQRSTSVGVTEKTVQYQ